MTHRIAASPPLRILTLAAALITAALLLMGLTGTGHSAQAAGHTSTHVPALADDPSLYRLDRVGFSSTFQPDQFTITDSTSTG